MQIRVLVNGGIAPQSDTAGVTLVHDNWNDWWEWETLYVAYYYDEVGNRHRLGSVKIALEDQESPIPALPQTFESAPEGVMSLGQHDSYYTNVVTLMGSDARTYLHILGDLAYNLDRFDVVNKLTVVSVSLLRSVSVASVKGQFSRILQGNRRTQAFEIAYIEPIGQPEGSAEVIGFRVDPEAVPPTNIHVLIGRNGSGKTRLLMRMADALIRQNVGQAHRFESREGLPLREAVAGVGYVSFSAFDRQAPLREASGRGLTVFNVGLKRINSTDPGARSADSNSAPSVQLKGFPEVLADMGQALYSCMQKSPDRWQTAVRHLESDPIFQDINATEFTEGISRDGLSPTAEERFKLLSSGHQIVLLAITSLVANIEERTLVLIDEPEGHLHPPLLAAYVRALSNILHEANAFAIVATHSPVVLQEVPRKCTHIVERSGDTLSVRSPRLETFGENVGILTHEIFGLEVEDSGFHRLLREKLLDSDLSYEDMVRLFGGELGGEALSLVAFYALSRGSVNNVELEF